MKQKAVVVLQRQALPMGEALAQALQADLFVPAGVPEGKGIPYPNGVAGLLRERFRDYQGWILIMALGVATRSLQGLLRDKRTDPAVVVCDAFGRFVIPIVSGHEGGANGLAYEVCRVTGAIPVITTATESWRRYVVGIGCRRGVTAEAIERAVSRVLEEARVKQEEVREVATIQRKGKEAGLLEFCQRHSLPLRTFSPETLKREGLFLSRSPFVESATGVPGVCEPCALLASHGGSLVKAKTRLGGVAVALVKEHGFASSEDPILRQAEATPGGGGPAKGKLYLVSIGPGEEGLITPRALQALADSDVVVGYGLYLNLIGHLLAGKERIERPLGQEPERAAIAIEKASWGKQVSLVSSGDIGIYGMASVIYELLERKGDDLEVELIPGVSAANAAAALLGAPLAHDFASISLSDWSCPWESILEKLRHAAQANLVIVLYNVQSGQRQGQVYEALEQIAAFRSPHTPCGVVRNAYRPGEQVSIQSLAELMRLRFDMRTTLIIGSSATRLVGKRLVTSSSGLPGEQSGGASGLRSPGAGQEDSVWVFSGTSDGNRLAREIHDAGFPTAVFSASEYGVRVAAANLPRGVLIHAGRLNRPQLETLIQERKPKAIVDATHPYATRISENLLKACTSQSVPYLRWERPSEEVEYERLEWADSLEAAARGVALLGKRVFLATGSKGVEEFIEAVRGCQAEIFVRLIPDPERIRRVLELGIPPHHLIAVQGPFSEEMNRSLWRDLRIDCVVTKESGEAGGFREKIDAARSLGIPVVAIRRPRLNLSPALVFNDPASLLDRLRDLTIPKESPVLR